MTAAAAAELPDDGGVEQAKAAIDKVMGGDPTIPNEEEAATADRRKAAGMLWRLRKVRHNLRTAEAEYGLIEDELAIAKESHLGPLRVTQQTLERALALWHHARRQEDPKHAKTIKLPTGTLESKEAQPRFEYTDEEAFLKWAQIALTVGVRKPPAPPPEIAKDPVKKALSDPDQYEVGDDGTVTVKATGEKVPGLVVRPGGTADLGVNYTAKT